LATAAILFILLLAILGILKKTIDNILSQYSTLNRFKSEISDFPDIKRKRRIFDYINSIDVNKLDAELTELKRYKLEHKITETRNVD
jgi:hypothetical protein